MTSPSTMRGFESSLPIALLRARQATAHKFKPHTDAAGLTQPQWRVIRALAAGEPLDVATLANRCVLMQPSVSRLLTGLQDRGLIETVPGSDARRRLLTLTEEGRRTFNRIAVISEAVYRDIEAVYGREDLARLVEMLVRLREVAEALPDLPRVLPDLPGEPA
ncbi:MarR family transcriptional regulator [Tabrizicola oligotrophica]|uniref:MarR family transcriptional regulator n=1 Tax=Tabrizicola oligotrophica TaxID=2710650 RepID=A0A6M0QW77_9RHOB|nr:MarR family transcriptional regulator [Tabrizicola oligotrophica]NEY91657.1 MarR family transcriptional regulator [Tabrizicola oligotrophica]